MDIGEVIEIGEVKPASLPLTAPALPAEPTPIETPELVPANRYTRYALADATGYEGL